MYRNILIILIFIILQTRINIEAASLQYVNECTQFDLENYETFKKDVLEEIKKTSIKLDNLDLIHCYASKYNDKELEAIYHAYKAINISDFVRNIGDLYLIFDHLDIALELTNELDFNTLKIQIYAKYISILTANKIYHNAQIFGKLYLELALKSNDSTIIGNTYMHLGRLERDLGKYKVAKTHLTKAFNYLSTSNDINAIGFTYLHLATLKRLEGKSNEAVNLLDQALQTILKDPSHSKNLQNYLRMELIFNYIELNIFDEEVQTNLNLLNTKIDLVHIYFYYIKGVLYEKQKNIKLALNSYQKSLQISDSLSNDIYTINIAQKLLPLLYKTGKIDFKTLNDLTIIRSSFDSLVHMTFSSNTFQHDFLDYKNKKNKFNLSNLNSNQYNTLLFYTLILLGISLIFYVIYNNKYLFNNNLLKINQNNEELKKLVYISNKKSIQLLDLKNNLNKNIFISEKLIVHLSKFVSEISNNIIEPISAINYKAKGLNNSTATKINNYSSSSLDDIIRSTLNLKTLVSRIRDYGENTFSIMKSFKKVNLNDLFKTVITNLNSTIRIKNAYIICHELKHIYGDEILLNQLFHNLIIISIKNAQPNSRHKIDVSGKTVNDEYIITITDNGIGIQTNDDQEIYDTFKNNPVNDVEPEIGMELAVCNEIVELHNGKMRYNCNVSNEKAFHIAFKINVCDYLL